MAYTYDGNSNRLSVETGAGTTTYTYDDLNRVETVTDTSSGVTTYSYDLVGNMLSVAHANGTLTSYAYDNLNRLTNMGTQDSLGTMLTSFDYTLDNVGNRTQIVELGRTLDYVYDDLYRLTEEAITDPTNGDVTFNYTYDKVGNRLTKSVDSVLSESYTYDDNDRVTVAGASTFTYDANGNTQTEASGAGTTTFVYDQDDRLRTVTTPSDSLAFSYDVDGVRQSKTVNGTLTQFTVDEMRPYAQVLEERDSLGGLLTNYTYGSDLLSQNVNGLGESYFHYDGLGSTRGLTDGAETLTDTYAYEAFGVETGSTGATPNAYRFAGEQLDAETGDYYLRARYYGTSVGRFRRMDTWMGDPNRPTSLNKYIYTEANPVNGIDPSGHFTIMGVSNVFALTSIIGGTSFLNVFETAGAATNQVLQDLKAYEALRKFNPISIDENIELGGLIYKVGPMIFGHTNFQRGTRASVDPYLRIGEVPSGAEVVGHFHTHGDYSIIDFVVSNGKARVKVTRTGNPNRDDFNSDEFSRCPKGQICTNDDFDLSHARKRANGDPRYRSYLGTPSGIFRVYNPTANMESVLRF